MADADLLVVGGGFWGTAVAHEARRRGRDVVLLDDGRDGGASRAAAGLSCRGWFEGDGTVRKMEPAWWGRRQVERGFFWLRQRGGREVGEWFASYQRPEWRFRPDLVMVESCQAVLGITARATGRVERLERTGTGWRAVGDVDVRARQVVVAAGAFTDTLLVSSRLPVVGVRGLWGSALVLEPAEPPGLFLPKTFMARPYAHYTLRPWPGGLLRLGDSVDRTRDGGLRTLWELERVARELAPGARVVDVLEGLRPVCGRFVVERRGPGLVVATGGHRVGLAMSAPVADRALELLEAE